MSPSVMGRDRDGERGGKSERRGMESVLLNSGEALGELTEELEQRQFKELWVDPTGWVYVLCGMCQKRPIYMKKNLKRDLCT